jgi:HSP20 family protein
MTLIKRNIHGSPWFNAFFDDEPSRNFATDSMFSKGTVPAVNIKESEKEYRLELAVPGLKKEDFNIELNGAALTVNCKKEVSEEKKDANYTQREFHYSSFSRSFTLPEKKIDFEKINALYVDGILEIILPKLEQNNISRNKVITVG